MTLAASLGAASASAPNTLVGAIACIVLLLLGLFGTPTLLKADRRAAASAELAQADAGEAAPVRRPSLREIGRRNGLWRSVAVSAAVLVTVDLLYTFVPLWATERGVSSVAVGLLLAIRAVVSVFSRIGLSRLVARFGRKTLLLVAIGCGVAALIALPFVGALGAIPVMVALGIALGLPQPLTMSWVVRITPKSVHGQALGLRMTANRLAQIVLPLAIGTAAGPLGISVILWANAAVLATALIIVSGSDIDRGVDQG
ncbi:MFS transporter [Pseudoclavibacter terrae]|uniref:MFS transporter n=1 Tax=Pseudoclavibacter terrae TaxID=1530195 RepID=UPI00232DCA7A|nr:MFS transporter [Pseudoclavibacter terrae]